MVLVQLRRQCILKLDMVNVLKKKAPFKCFECHKEAHFSRDCADHKSKNENVSFACSRVGQLQPNNWYIDSGSSSHLTYRENWLQNIHESAKDDVTVANSQRLEITQKGDVLLRAEVNANECIDVEVTDALHAPGLCANLLSVGFWKFCWESYTF